MLFHFQVINSLEMKSMVSYTVSFSLAQDKVMIDYLIDYLIVKDAVDDLLSAFSNDKNDSKKQPPKTADAGKEN